MKIEIESNPMPYHRLLQAVPVLKHGMSAARRASMAWLAKSRSAVW